jgi:hypothetical protein
VRGDQRLHGSETNSGVACSFDEDFINFLPRLSVELEPQPEGSTALIPRLIYF